MIIKSSNKPLEITFTEDLTNITVLRITLWNDDTLLKLWTKNDIVINGDKITAPLTQEETASFPEGKAILEIKWLDSENNTEFANKASVKIMERKDLEVM